MLEDNAERIERFATTLTDTAPNLEWKVWRDAHVMMREAEPWLSSAKIISLDHDLEEEPGESDLGTGYDVVKWLTTHPAVCPVIIHSSNGERSSWMAGELDLGGWCHYRVVPFGDDWIERDWKQMVRRLLRIKR